MPDLATKNLDQMVADQAAAAQAEAPLRALDFGRGTVFRALAHGFGAIAMWLQGLVLRVLANTRAATSKGPDLDSWMADYGVKRTEARSAGGTVTFARFTPGLPALIPIGATVKTADGAWSYRVVAAPGASPEEAQQGYTISPGQSSLAVPVQAVMAGAGGNAAANTVTLLSSAIPGVDTVSNPVALTGGIEAEDDDALQVRFRAYINSLPKGVRAAIDYAVSQVQAGLTWTVLEFQRPDGSAAPSFFTVVVDDGTGSPSPSLIARVTASVELVRALGVAYAVVAPVPRLVSVNMAITTPPGVDHAAVVAAVVLALRAYINSLPLGSGLSYTRLSTVAYQASPLVENITSYLVNGASADIPASPRQAVRAGTMAVS